MFTDAAARQLIGKRVIVGITNRGEDGELLEHEQYDCHILRASAAEGIVLQTHAGDLLTLPPDLRPYFGARPGEYRFKSTDHVAVDPDLQTTWTRTLPPSRSLTI